MLLILFLERSDSFISFGEIVLQLTYIHIGGVKLLFQIMRTVMLFQCIPSGCPTAKAACQQYLSAFFCPVFSQAHFVALDAAEWAL